MRQTDVSVSRRLDIVSPRGKARLRWSIPIFGLGAGTLEFAFQFTGLAVNYAFARYRPPLNSYQPLLMQMAYGALAFTLGGALVWWLFVVVGRRVSAGDGAATAAVSTLVSVVVASVALIALNPSVLVTHTVGVFHFSGWSLLLIGLPWLVFNRWGLGVPFVLAAWGAFYGGWLRRSLIKKRDAVAESGV